MADKVISSIIALKNIDLFSALEVKVAYIAIKQDEQLDPVFVRRFVYEELLKLVKKGWLSKSITKQKKLARYSKTDLFDHNYFKELANSSMSLDGYGNDGHNYSQELSTRLKEHNVELLEGLGELELYFTLWEQYPSMKNNLKAKYIEAQERNHILKGKINAIGELLKNTTET
jgi:hypothetical protein